MSQLFTIGCSVHSIEDFCKLLKLHLVNCIVDVRSVPFSAFTPQFNKDVLSLRCKDRDIFYVHMGEQFGAQREEKDLYSHDDKGYYVDFSKVAQSKIFRNGIDRIVDGLSKGYNIALMCTEKDPIDCHRAILVARNFALKNVDVRHILFDGTLLTQGELDKRLVQRYEEKKSHEIDLFDMVNFNVGEKNDTPYNLVADAYRRRGIEIAFRKEFL